MAEAQVEVVKSAAMDETKVTKQVTFQQPDDIITEKSPKKPRKRLRGIMTLLKNQMEFYFSDSNMSKDRYMKQKIEKTSDSYLPLSEFINFNKIKELTEDLEVLAKSLRFSQMLEVNEDGTKVRRTTPVRYLSPEEIDARTIYVEGFPKNLTHDWFHKRFAVCGKVNYVSLPRYKSSNDIKGFAFVEFETPEEATKAIETLNFYKDKEEVKEEPEEKIGSSIKQSSNLRYFKKRAAKEGINLEDLEKARKEEKEAAEAGEEQEEGKEVVKKSKSKKKKKKKKSSQLAAQGEKPAEGEKQTEGPSAEAANTANAAKSEPPVDADKTGTKKKKRKRKRGASQSVESVEDLTAEGARDTADPPAATGGKFKSAKGVLMSVPEDQMAEKPTSAGDDGGGKSQKSKKGKAASVTMDNSGDCGSVTKALKSEKPSEQERVSRKRKGPAGEESEETPAKVGKRDGDSEKHGAVKQEEKSKQEESTDADKSQEECAQGKKEGGKDSEPQKNRKRRKDDADSKQDKESSGKKQRGGKQPGNKRSVEQSDSSAGEGRKRKRKSLEATNEDGTKIKIRRSHSSLAEDTQTGVEEGGKKRRHRKKKGMHLVLALRVMSKKDWSNLKEEYLGLQKKNMTHLKEQLKEASRDKNQRKKQNSGDSQTGQVAETNTVAETNSSHPPPVFTPNAILEVKSDVGMCHQTIKEDMAPSVEVSYIDVKPGMTVGHIRCKDADSAAMLLEKGIKGCSLALVEGSAEKAYWDKLISDREARLSSGKRPKRRGKHKLLQRAQNPLGEIFVGQHLKFNDNEESEHKTDETQDEFNTYTAQQ